MWQTKLEKIIKCIIQHIVTLPKHGNGELNIRRPHITYPAIYVILCIVKKNGRALSKRNDQTSTRNY